MARLAPAEAAAALAASAGCCVCRGLGLALFAEYVLSWGCSGAGGFRRGRWSRGLCLALFVEYVLSRACTRTRLRGLLLFAGFAEERFAA
jgi:hypothetical protein